MTNEVTLWAVYTNSDLTEGRGRQYVAHFCRTEATAIRLARRGYVQGSNCPVEPVTCLVLDGKHVLPVSLINVVEPSKEDEAEERKLEARRAAISRAKELGLTDEEISAIVKTGAA